MICRRVIRFNKQSFISLSCCSEYKVYKDIYTAARLIQNLQHDSLPQIVIKCLIKPQFTSDLQHAILTAYKEKNDP